MKRGENMIRFPDSSLRYYTIHEAARIQTFPDRYQLHGAWSEAMRQLGNAVPVMLAETIVPSVVEHLDPLMSRLEDRVVRRRCRTWEVICFASLCHQENYS